MGPYDAIARLATVLTSGARMPRCRPEREGGLVRRDERQRVRVGGRDLDISNLDKVLYAASGTTKADVLRYYLEIADVLLPHLAGRAVTLRRYPDGVDGEAFYQKRCPDRRPPWIGTAQLGREGGRRPTHCVLAEPAALAWAANLAALELHVPLGSEPDPQVPNAVVFDLDPGPPAGLLDTVTLALDLRRLFDRLGLAAVPKTSGGKGVQVYVPLNRSAVDYEQTRSFAGGLARLLERAHPDRVVATQTRAKRVGKVLVDWTQNHPTKTTVCVYSLRGGQRPTVSVPLRWEELERAASARDVDALRFEPDAALARVREHGDLFADVRRLSQSLPDVAPSAGRRGPRC